MHSHTIKAAPLVGQRFHNLVSSGILVPYEGYDEDGEHRHGYFLGENKEAVDYLSRLRDAIKRIAKSKNPPWREVSVLGQTRYIMSSEARSLWNAFRNIGVAPKAWGREGQMNPYLGVGVRLARKWYPRLQLFTSMGSDLLLAEEYPRRILAHIVFAIRRACTTKVFVSQVKRLERQQQDNFTACCQYFLDILRAHARPLVLRADLYVDGEGKLAAEEGKIEQALEKFIRNLREKRIIPGVLGYIIKREDAYDRGIHLHLMVIVDGDKHFQSYNLTEILKTYWIYECIGSPKLASGFNCYLRKDEYRYNGIGLVHYTDESMLLGVRGAIDYLTKTDGHFLVPKEFGKNMRKGQSPRQDEDGKRRGAPRKFSNDVSLAESILLGKHVEAQ